MADGQDENGWLGHSRSGPSPIVVLAMSAANLALKALGGLVGLIGLVLVWTRRGPEGFAFVNGDFGVLAILAILMVSCLVLARYIAREMNRYGHK